MIEIWRQGLGDDDELGALVYSPGAIKAEMDTVDANLTELDRDISGSAVREAFKSAWKGFVAEWKAFYAAHQSWYDNLWGASYDKALEYRERLEKWREAFVREGGNSTAPPLSIPGFNKDPRLIASSALWFAGGVFAFGLAAALVRSAAK